MQGRWSEQLKRQWEGTSPEPIVQVVEVVLFLFIHKSLANVDSGGEEKTPLLYHIRFSSWGVWIKVIKDKWTENKKGYFVCTQGVSWKRSENSPKVLGPESLHGMWVKGGNLPRSDKAKGSGCGLASPGCELLEGKHMGELMEDKGSYADQSLSIIPWCRHYCFASICCQGNRSGEIGTLVQGDRDRI